MLTARRSRLALDRSTASLSKLRRLSPEDAEFPPRAKLLSRPGYGRPAIDALVWRPLSQTHSYLDRPSDAPLENLEADGLVENSGNEVESQFL